jgi:5-deoxy-glucuronate isomerase
LTAESPLEVAVCSAPADRGQREPVLATAQDYEIEVRGAGNATRRVVTPLGPNFDAHRLVVVEVWTPAGNWSSYPPHKHDETRQPDEVALEETFFFKVSTADGFALQRLYSEERSFDMTWAVGDGDLLLVPWGYHTTVAAPGHDLYYLNVLAGDARELRPFEDPAYAPIREAWRFEEPDPRVVSAATREATRR